MRRPPRSTQSRSSAASDVYKREGLHLLRGDATERELDPDHLHVGLALAIHPLLEAEADELLLRGLALEELLRLVVEVVELALDDREHVPRHVVVDLGVLQRAHLALAPLLLVGVLPVSYTHLRAHETKANLVCRLLLEK